MSEEKKELTMAELESEVTENTTEETTVLAADVLTAHRAATEEIGEAVEDTTELKPKRETELNPNTVSSALLTAFDKLNDMGDRANAILSNANEQILIQKQLGDIPQEVDGVALMAATVTANGENTEENNEYPTTAKDEPSTSLYESLSEEFMDESGNEIAKEKLVKKQELIRSKIREAIKPTTDKLDLSTFSIENEPSKLFNVFNSTAAKEHHIADWYLPNSELLISMREFSGMEIEKLNPANSNRTEFNTYTDIYQLIYDHIINEGKPSYEEFIKLIKYDDDAHLYAAIFKASFSNSNVFPYQCEKKSCGEVFVESIADNENIKFVDEQKKKEFFDAMEAAPATFAAKKFQSEVIQVNDEYAVSIYQPSLFNVIFETMSLKKEFRDEHASKIGIIMYINNIFHIDKAKRALVPVELKTFEDDVAKSVRYKIYIYSQIIDNISSDSLQALTSTIAKISAKDPIDYYVIPERKCPKCGTVIKEKQITAKDLLFTRHQLGALANS